MPKRSGVYICPIVPTKLLSNNSERPGDIDLLIIPYEEDELILDRVMALEVKAIRASFEKQGKSPNDFGFSQAKSLWQLGFPFVGVAHLIFSDTSPESAWRDIGVVRVVDEQGRAETLPDQRIDWLPIDLVGRAFGRLKATSPFEEIGLVSTFIGNKSADITGENNRSHMWLPECRRALRNPYINKSLLKNVADLFETRPECFLDNPRYDPA